MILIISDTEDTSTSAVLRKLTAYGQSFFRVTENVFIQNFFIEIVKTSVVIVLDFGIKCIDLSTVDSVLYRRGKLRFAANIPNALDKNTKWYVEYHFKNDLEDLSNYIYLYLKNHCYTLGAFNRHRVNKLCVLEKAAKSGLNVPNTTICDGNKINANYRGIRGVCGYP